MAGRERLFLLEQTAPTGCCGPQSSHRKHTPYTFLEGGDQGESLATVLAYFVPKLAVAGSQGKVNAYYSVITVGALCF